MDILQGKKLVMKNCQTYNANYYLKRTKIIAYYFSASWVDDLELLEKLKVVYDENEKRHIGLEVIYVSSDTDEKQFAKYFRDHHGNWPGIALKYLSLADLIRHRYNITCLPQIVVVRKEDGFLITRRGKEELEKNGVNVLVVWSDYEPDLTVLEESLIELHYPQPKDVPVSAPPPPATPEAIEEEEYCDLEEQSEQLEQSEHSQKVEDPEERKKASQLENELQEIQDKFRSFSGKGSMKPKDMQGTDPAMQHVQEKYRSYSVKASSQIEQEIDPDLLQIQETFRASFTFKRH